MFSLQSFDNTTDILAALTTGEIIQVNQNRSWFCVELVV